MEAGVSPGWPWQSGAPYPSALPPLSASPRLLLANSGHLIKGLVGLMVVSVSPHAGYYHSTRHLDFKEEAWEGGLVC